MREVEAELDDGTSHPILLVRNGGEVTALGAKCTHYQYPLAKAVLSNGIIRCPLHGACFNAQTGDIEDFPGLDSLPKYQISQEGGRIFLQFDDVNELCHKRVKDMAERGEDEEVFVILGGGPASLSCAETLRQEGFTGRIVMVIKEKRLPYDRIKLSKNLAIEAESIALRSRSFFEDHGIEVLLDAEVAKVNLVNQSVMTKRFRHLEYSKLLIATGASPRVIPIRGGENAKNIRYLRTPDDANAIYNEAKGQDILIVGSGFIGMEVASALIDVATRVTVVTMDAVPFQLQLGEKLGRCLRQWHEARGVRFQCKTSVRKVNVEPVNGDVYEVILNNARIIPACLVVVGVGIVPNTTFLPSFPELEQRPQPFLTLNQNGFIKVSPFMETSVENVFAAGDVVEFPLRLPTDRRTEFTCISHWQMALKMGNVAAKNMFMKPEDEEVDAQVNANAADAIRTTSNASSENTSAGRETDPGSMTASTEEEEEPDPFADADPRKTRFVSVPFFWSVQYGQSLRFAGFNKDFEEVIIHGQPEVSKEQPDPAFVAFYVRAGRVVAAASLNKDPFVAQFAETLRNGIPVKADIIREDPEGFLNLLPSAAK